MPEGDTDYGSIARRLKEGTTAEVRGTAPGTVWDCWRMSCIGQDDAEEEAGGSVALHHSGIRQNFTHQHADSGTDRPRVRLRRMPVGGRVYLHQRDQDEEEAAAGGCWAHSYTAPGVSPLGPPPCPIYYTPPGHGLADFGVRGSTVEVVGVRSGRPWGRSAVAVGGEDGAARSSPWPRSSGTTRRVGGRYYDQSEWIRVGDLTMLMVSRLVFWPGLTLAVA